MKKQILLFGLLLSQLTLNAQDNTSFNKWSLGASIGVHDGATPTSTYTKMYQIHHFGGNARYMFNNRVGVMLDLGYDFFDATGSGARNTNYFRTSIQGVVNTGDILKLNTLHDQLGLLIHGGAGISNMWINKDFRTALNPTDPLFKGVDDMVNFIFGITPQLKVSEKISLNADMSFIFHHNQTYNFDMVDRNMKGAIDGYFLNLSVGASFYLGTKAKHADWTPTVYGAEAQDFSSYEAKVKELEDRLKDDDMDGVPNYVDAEPNTTKGAFVDSKGVALLDADDDGIADKYDLCPNQKGLYSLNGCLDSDGDGLSDSEDACPTVAGTKANRGCPEISKEVKEVLIRALKGVQFETNKDVLLVSSFTSLNEVVSVLNDHPEYRLKIEGHTDSDGTDEHNIVLSQKRSEAVANYLVSKGIDKSRFDSYGFGETRPKALNDTDAGKALNRRVEFTIVFN